MFFSLLIRFNALTTPEANDQCPLNLVNNFFFFFILHAGFILHPPRRAAPNDVNGRILKLNLNNGIFPDYSENFIQIARSDKSARKKLMEKLEKS